MTKDEWIARFIPTYLGKYPTDNALRAGHAAQNCYSVMSNFEPELAAKIGAEVAEQTNQSAAWKETDAVLGKVRAKPPEETDRDES